MSAGDPAHLSGYRLMWIFVMFDLPVGCCHLWMAPALQEVN